MPRKITNLNKGVYVMITPANSRALGRIIARTGRTFSKEVNMAITDYVARHNGGDQQTDEEPAHATA